MARVREALVAHGFSGAAGEPLKIVIEAGKNGYTGEEIAGILRKSNIEPEFADADFLVLMCTPENSEEDFARLLDVLCALPILPPRGGVVDLPHIRPVSRLSFKEAMLSPTETVPLERAQGRICATPAVSCPPAVPIVVAGELIDADAISLFAHYGIDKIAVVK